MSAFQHGAFQHDAFQLETGDWRPVYRPNGIWTPAPKVEDIWTLVTPASPDAWVPVEEVGGDD